MGRWNSSAIKKAILTLWITLCCLGFTIVWLASFYLDDGRIVSTNRGIWSDFAMHSTLMYFYIEQPLHIILSETPLLAAANMPYPPLANLLSTLLLAHGVSLYWALLIQSLFFSYLGCAGLVLAFAVFTRSVKASAVATLLFLLCGGLGFLDAIFSPESLLELMEAGRVTNDPARGLAFANVIVNIWQPQRSFLTALPFTLLYFVLFYTLTFRSKCPGKIHYAAIPLSALLAFLSQAHSLIALFIFSATLLLLYWREHRFRLLKSGLFTFLAVGIWGAYLLRYGSGDLNIRWAFNENPLGQQLGPFLYILLNWAHILILVGMAWWSKPRLTRELIILGATFFSVGHLIIFQPWSFDNLKILIWAYFFWSAALGIWIVSLWKLSGKHKVLAVATGAILCMSGSLDILGQFTSDKQIEMVTPEMLHHAQLVRDHTPQNAVIMANDFLYSPVGLAGRRRLCAYEGWLWSYGLNFQGQFNLKKTFYKSPNIYPDIERYGLTHFISQTRRPQFVDISFQYEAVIEQAGFNLYKVLPPRRDDLE